MAYDSDMKDEKKRIKLKCTEDYLKINKNTNFLEPIKSLNVSFSKYDEERRTEKRRQMNQT